MKLKTASFTLITRQHSLHEPTDVAERLYSVGLHLLGLIKDPGPFRLIGMFTYDLVNSCGSQQLDMFALTSRHRQLETAVDELVARFGHSIVRRANETRVDFASAFGSDARFPRRLVVAAAALNQKDIAGSAPLPQRESSDSHRAWVMSANGQMPAGSHAFQTQSPRPPRSRAGGESPRECLGCL